MDKSRPKEEMGTQSIVCIPTLPMEESGGYGEVESPTNLDSPTTKFILPTQNKDHSEAESI